MATTAANMGYSHFSNNLILGEARWNLSSSPSLRLDRFFPLKKKVDATQPTQSKQVYAIVVVNGQPLAIAQNSEPQIEKTLDKTDTQPAVALIERLDLIKDRLALSITQMAELFGVTRKSVYDWYDGAEPRSTTMSRMEVLIDVLNMVLGGVDLRRLKAVWNIPVSGKSFRVVFGDEDIATLRTALAEKLNELSPRMVVTTSSMQKTTAQFGEAHLAEFDRRTDFG